MMHEPAKQWPSTHMQDFKSPWQHVRYIYGEKLIPRREILPPGEYGDGCVLQLSGHLSVRAAYICRDQETESWNCSIESEKNNRQELLATHVIRIKNGEDASKKLLTAAWEQLMPSVQALRKATSDLYHYMLSCSEPQDEPVPTKPSPDIWYQADRYVPENDKPVIVAWTDIFGIEHPGDRTAIYKNGQWHWAFGEQDPISDKISVTDWTACPEPPDYPQV